MFRPQFLDPVENYPYKLEQMLRSRYGSSEIVVINEGLGGETIEEGTERFAKAMEMHHPEVVLLLEGYNGLRETPLSAARSGLRGMARWAQTHGADVVLATLFQISEDREDSRPGSQAAIDDLNDAIRGLGSTPGAWRRGRSRAGVRHRRRACSDQTGCIQILPGISWWPRPSATRSSAGSRRFRRRLPRRHRR